MLSLSLEETINALNDARKAVREGYYKIGETMWKIPSGDHIDAPIARLIDKLIAEEKSHLALAAHWAEHSA